MELKLIPQELCLKLDFIFIHIVNNLTKIQFCDFSCFIMMGFAFCGFHRIARSSTDQVSAVAFIGLVSSFYIMFDLIPVVLLKFK